MVKPHSLCGPFAGQRAPMVARPCFVRPMKTNKRSVAVFELEYKLLFLGGLLHVYDQKSTMHEKNLSRNVQISTEIRFETSAKFAEVCGDSGATLSLRRNRFSSTSGPMRRAFQVIPSQTLQGLFRATRGVRDLGTRCKLESRAGARYQCGNPIFG